MSQINALRAAFAAASIFLLTACGGGGGYSGSPQPPAPPAPPPATVTLRQPPGLSVNRAVSLSADAGTPANVTVKRVEFLVDGTVAGTATTSPYTFAWDTSAVADGAHALTARLTDSLDRTVTSTAVSVTVKNRLSFDLTLTPDEIFFEAGPGPGVDSRATGTITVNLIDGVVTGGVTATGFVPINAHIHGGYAGVEGGPVLVPFARNATDPQRWDATPGEVLSAAEIDDLLAGKLYVNVHSGANVGGEVRAQLAPENITVVFTLMTEDEVVVGPGGSTATALAAVTVDTLAMTTTIHATTSQIANTTAMDVHRAIVGVQADAALYALTQDPANATHWSSTQPLTAAGLDTFKNNGWYIDLHTAAFPGGEIRGQIRATNSAALFADLVQSVFVPKCAGCHSGTAPNDGPLPASMDLTGAVAFEHLVLVPSLQQPNVLRVAPGNPDDSYLVRKLQGTAGITGVRMPQGGDPLDQSTMDKIRLWIVTGAELED